MAYKETVSIDDVLVLLNDLLAKDPSAVVSLVEKRTVCNDQIAEHPTVQVLTKDGVHYVGLLGILNGLFGVNEHSYGVLAIEMDDQTLKFQRFVRLDKLEASKPTDERATPDNKPEGHGSDVGGDGGTTP